MSSKSPPAAAAAPEPIKPPAPIPDPKAKETPTGSAALSYAEQQEAASEEQNTAGLGATANPAAQQQRRVKRDPASVANTAASSLGSSAVITG